MCHPESFKPTKLFYNSKDSKWYKTSFLWSVMREKWFPRVRRVYWQMMHEYIGSVCHSFPPINLYSESFQDWQRRRVSYILLLAAQHTKYQKADSVNSLFQYLAAHVTWITSVYLSV